MPHPGKKSSRGEDAYYISKCGRSVGVADGVGGWSEYGIDSGAFSRALMGSCEESVESGIKHPTQVLSSGFGRLKDDVTGTSTACVLTLHDGVLTCANLGDSGFMVARPLENCDEGLRLRLRNDPDSGVHELSTWGIIKFSQELVHRFNCPLQLGTQSTDVPEDAAVFELPVKRGDIVLTATDGLLDNMWGEQIVEHIENIDEDQNSDNSEVAPDDVLEHMCQVLVNDCCENARNKNFYSPFSDTAAKWGYQYIGGKMDDITLVVSRVQ